MVYNSQVAATCTAAGNTVNKCSRCTVTQTTPIAALGHNMVSNSQVAATCTAGGHTVNKCSRCTVTAQVNPVAALGHDISGDLAFDAHEHWHGCTRCTEKSGTAAHNSGAGVVTVPPSSLAAGEISFSCDACAYAYTDVVDDFTWVATNGATVITGYIGTNSIIAVPEKRGAAVTEIGCCAFSNGTMTSVTLPSNITVIGEGAFYGLSGLTSIDLSSVTNIGANAFDGAGLAKVSLNEGQSIGDGAFNNTPMNYILIKGNAPVLEGNLIEETKPVYYLPCCTNGWADFAVEHTNTVALRSAIDEATLVDDSAGFKFNITDNSGGALDLTVVIEAKDSLTSTGDWEVISTNELSAGRNFVDPSATNAASRFYKTRVIDAN